MRIMASQSANRVESIKILDGRYTQSGKETLMELYRVHFPGSAGEEVPWKDRAAKHENSCCSQGGLGTV
jgi:hypothetical protein